MALAMEICGGSIFEYLCNVFLYTCANVGAVISKCRIDLGIWVMPLHSIDIFRTNTLKYVGKVPEMYLKVYLPKFYGHGVVFLKNNS